MGFIWALSSFQDTSYRISWLMRKKYGPYSGEKEDALILKLIQIGNQS